ncbi:DUF6615 family protein [Bradyrhizobium liaoningense]|uniref:DUF6615 family protein n=1 Tax=Bradyrhizobium liaoningense TaxID=43992 RepID=UPI001BA64830|nr:DUF6615 family protein [Bradyrhizobium liaoningense]MBR0818113.1 hypothetical protein [Bradyrhizobium liaoningense]
MTTSGAFNASGILPSDVLCNTFTGMARKIWNELGAARKLGINRGEETVTDNFLLDVQAAHPVEVTTFQFNKPEEAITGADWEWWLTDGRRWAGLLIQAKILKGKANLYSSIKHKVRGRPQIDILLEQANLKGIPALYFLYNHTQLTFPKLSWNCGSIAPDIEQLGCTVAYAAAVKPLVKRGGVGITTLNPISVPLRCLVCCRVRAEPPDDPSLPSRATGIVKYLASRAADGPDRFDVPRVRADPPDYVRELITAPIDDRQGVIERVRSRVGSVGSLVVIKDRS